VRALSEIPQVIGERVSATDPGQDLPEVLGLLLRSSGDEHVEQKRAARKEPCQLATHRPPHPDRARYHRGGWGPAASPFR
jgi:hypothetical protein